MNDLYQRGLVSENTELIVVDGGKGLLAALGLVYPRAPVQHCLRQDLESLLEFMSFEKQWRPQVRTTNAIERQFREVKPRTRPMGAFSDRTSMERMLYAVLMYKNYK